MRSSGKAFAYCTVSMVTADFDEQYPRKANFDSRRFGSVTAANEPSALDTLTIDRRLRGAQERQHRVRDAHDPENVGLVDTAHVLGRRVAGCDPVPGDPCIVDQHVEPRRLPFDPCGCRPDRRVVSDVYRNEACAQPLGRSFTPLAVARSQVHGVPEGDQPSTGFESKTLVRTGDECRGHSRVPHAGRSPLDASDARCPAD